MKRTLLFRSLSVFLALVMAFTASAEGLRLAAVTTFDWVRIATQSEPPDYTEAPGSVDPGPNPGRDEATQDGIWDNDSKTVLGDLEEQQAAATAEPYTTAPFDAPPNTDPMAPSYDETRADDAVRKRVHGPMSDSEANFSLQGGLGIIGGGPPLPWESAFPGGGSNSVSAIVNSNTGNRFMSVPLFSFGIRGGMSMGITMMHNSRTEFLGPFGKKWSTNYDARLTRDNPHGALSTGNIITLRWGNGQTIPFKYDANKSPVGWYPPDGIYDRITLGGTTHSEIYTLTTKHGTRYEFSHPKPGDSNYCGQGVLTKIIDRSNNTITIARENASARILTITDPVGRRISFGYETNPDTGRVRQIKDCYAGTNRVWSFEYSNGNLTKIKSPALSSVIYERVFAYDSNSNITTETDHRGQQWGCSYDASNRCTNFWEPGIITAPPYTGYAFSYQTTFASMTEWSGQYEKHHYSGGKIWSLEDAAGFSERYSWDSVRRIYLYRDKRGATWTYSLDAKGNVLSETAPTGEHSYATYNTNNETTSTYGDIGPSTVRYEYQNGNLTRAYRDLTVDEDLVTCSVNSNGQTIGATSYDGVQTRPFSFTFDGYGNPDTVVDTRSKTSDVNASILGWVTSVKNQLNHQTNIGYDEWGRPTLVTQPGNATVQIQYDPEGNVTYVTDERGKQHAWTYNERGLVSTYTNAKSETEEYRYTTTGFLYWVKNGRGKIRTYTATSRDEVKGLDMPDGTKERWSYNGNGDVGAYTGAFGVPGEEWTTTYGFDGSGRPVSVTYPNSTVTPNVTFQYENYGHTVKMRESNRYSTPHVWTYNSWGDLTSFESPDGATLNYTYNRLGERLSMQDTTSGVGTSSYEYDNFGRLKKLTNWLNEITTWEYDDAGRMIKRTLGNGTWEDIVYDTRSRPTWITLRKPGPVVLRQQSYTYDAASNVLSHTLAGVTTTYEYDDINQLTREYKGTSGSPTWQIQYGYDGNGNRSYRNILGGAQETYTNDDGDKLTGVAWSGGSKSFTYDAAGRRKTQTVGGQTTTYNWDHESRLISTTGAVATSYAYNGLDSRISKTDSGGTRNYRRDGAYVTDPVLGDGQATYTPGISEVRSGTSRYLHSGIKNADSRTTTQAVEATREYDAFGNVIGSSGTWQGPFGNAGGYGYQEDDDTGLKLLGHRYYDSTIGCFVSRDPLQSGRNWAAYCDANPIGRVDRDGLQKKDVLGYKSKKGRITITVHNRGFGHATIIVQYPDKRGTMVLENVMNGNIRVGDGWANPDAPTAMSFRTKDFEVDRFPTPYDMYVGFPTEYNLVTNQCADFAGYVWKRVTGESLDVRTPGRLEKKIKKLNADDARRRQSVPLKPTQQKTSRGRS